MYNNDMKTILFFLLTGILFVIPQVFAQPSSLERNDESYEVHSFSIIK